MKNLSPQEYINNIISYEEQKQKELDSFIEKKNAELYQYEQSLQKFNEQELQKFKLQLEQQFKDELEKYKQQVQTEFEEKLNNLKTSSIKVVTSFSQLIPELKSKIFNLWQ